MSRYDTWPTDEDRAYGLRQVRRMHDPYERDRYVIELLATACARRRKRWIRRQRATARGRAVYEAYLQEEIL